jgi:transglutaminase-like putative cysteine protease
MRRWLISLMLVCLQAASTDAGGKTGKVVFEQWDAAYLGEGRAGYVHTIAREIDKDGHKLIRTTAEMRLTAKRFSDTIEMSADSGTIETESGKVVGVFMRQFIGKTQKTLIEGTVVDKVVEGVVMGKELRLVANGKPLEPAPWNDQVVGLFKQQSIYQEQKLKPGDRFTYFTFEPTINIVLTIQVKALGYRQVELKGTTKKEKMLLIETIPNKLELKRGNETMTLQLPISLNWLNEKREQVKMEVDIPGLGPVVMYRTSKEEALAPAPLAQLTDIGIGQLVRLKNRILQPYETTQAVYRITIRNDDNAATTFTRDDRQQVKNVQGNTFDLHVKASKMGNEAGGEKEPAAEYLQSCYFINSEDAKVKQLARQAVGQETDPWRKSLRIEKWVHSNMRTTNYEALATSDEVARKLEGDCTEYSMLTAAMCRAEGVPSRTAIGLIYADVKTVPCFAFHMWTEVWIKGRWIPIDATLGKGYVGATHLKITDSSWHDQRTMTPIFPVIRVVGRVSIDILSAQGR